MIQALIQGKLEFQISKRWTLVDFNIYNKTGDHNEIVISNFLH